MVLTVEDLDRRVGALERAQGETTETLRWVVTKLARVQAVQDEHTLRLERLESKVDTMGSKMDALPHAIAEMVDASEKRIMAAIAGRR
jgi:DNA polymerase III alpha subunit (gram-positive type)